jgi:hypothetical protein
VSDCAAVTRQVDCCGSLIVTGVHADLAGMYTKAAAQCASEFPQCDCLNKPTSADDGSTDSGGVGASVDCVAGTCQTAFSGAVTPCGPSALACKTAAEVCVAREPVGPAIVYACKAVPAACKGDRSCTCMATSLCQAPFSECSDVGTNAIDCVCPLCQ